MKVRRGCARFAFYDRFAPPCAAPEVQVRRGGLFIKHLNLFKLRIGYNGQTPCKARRVVLPNPYFIAIGEASKTLRRADIVAPVKLFQSVARTVGNLY